MSDASRLYNDEIKEIIKSGNTYATVFISGLFLWWLTYFLPFDLSGRTGNDVPSTLRNMNELALNAHNRCSGLEAAYSLEKSSFSSCKESGYIYTKPASAPEYSGQPAVSAGVAEYFVKLRKAESPNGSKLKSLVDRIDEDWAGYPGYMARR